MPDLMYLRKSRADMDLEARGEKDVLARHEAELMRSAARLGRTITAVYREVVTGETIASRPVMQRLLREVEAGMWEAVHVVEVERLARGDTMDQGIVARAFRYSQTLIITPSKIYDPMNEFDEEYFEFGLFMSRREYKAITRRQQRGRLASVNEGKYPGNKNPYGYRRVKLKGQKGWTLEMKPEEAEIVRSIFRWYTEGAAEGAGQLRTLSVSGIVRRLNECGVPSATGGNWTNAVIRELLRNPVYAGWIRWGRRSSVKKVENGRVVVSRPISENRVTLARGLHTPIISQATFEAAQARLNLHPSRPGPKQLPMKNPLSGLVFCGKCGRAMVRRPFSTGRPAALLCPNTACDTVSGALQLVEDCLLQALKDWLGDFEIGRQTAVQAEEVELEIIKKSLSAAERELKILKAQESRAFDLVEQGIYTPEIYLSRARELANRRSALEERRERLRAELSRMRQPKTDKEIVPGVSRVLDAYSLAETAEDKNELLKSVLAKVLYYKFKSSRGKCGGDMKLIILPKLPSQSDNCDVRKN